MSHHPKKKVVIVGGGYSGVYLAKSIDDRFDVTLVERKQLFFHNITALRLVVQPDLCEKVFIPMNNLLKNGRIIHKLAVEITPKMVVLDDGDVLTFDYLVIATGSNNMTPYKSPTDTSNLYPYYQRLQETVKKARSVAIIGGSTIGVELAGEIACEYPNKPVTLVQHIGRLCSHRLGDKFSDKLIKKMTKMGIKVMMNTVVDIPPEAVSNRNNMAVVEYELKEQVLLTDKNEKIEADLVFWCLGNRPNSEALRAHFGGSIDHMGHLKVNESMQVEGHENNYEKY
ncbi:putative apoptosis inducing factor [Heterostelium album PN500]|uniref:Putative apoptosis inducing factor n=1 Tax=Heterostelium pallidum (strain ATCC 26659 / Pp 5 / PN500) TaxID=670386 RepID=D3BJC9_HETP5|nr:putative apoptosis inducing factor [Heterostelium album PN500]EFA78009.1 putative apoptosis inducing factor [Heterostelium album PN500]|eukprot:XP_020430137.1 putative apoptosis inducing factor [Heterostelium album PN500]